MSDRLNLWLCLNVMTSLKRYENGYTYELAKYYAYHAFL
jgi:hypothetical protein